MEGEIGSTNVYRFVTAEQTLADARKAVVEERWTDAAAAAQALLRVQPTNDEARRISESSSFEVPHQAHFQEFTKAVSSGETIAALRAYAAIAPTSIYREKGKLDADRLRARFLDSQEGHARALARAGRCDDARRAVRFVYDVVPEARGRLDGAVSGCRASREEQPEASPQIAAASAVPIPSASPSAVEPPTAITAAPIGAPPPPPPVAAPQPAPAAKPEPAVAPPPPAAALRPAVSLEPRIVAAKELERFRVAGDKRPELPSTVQRRMSRDGLGQVSVAIRFCLNEKGKPSSVDLLKPSEYGDLNLRVIAEVKRWRYKPYRVQGTPVPACSLVTFVYRVE